MALELLNHTDGLSLEGAPAGLHSVGTRAYHALSDSRSHCVHPITILSEARTGEYALTIAC